MKCVKLMVLLVLTLNGTLCQAQLKVIHAFDEVTTGRMVSTVVAESTIYGVTDSKKLVVAAIDSPVVELTKLPMGPDQFFEPTFSHGPLVILDDLVAGGLSPGKFDIVTVRSDGSGFQTIADGADLGIGFTHPIEVEGRLFGASSKGVFSMQSDGSDIRIVQGDIASPTITPLVFNGEKVYGITADRFLDERSGLGIMFSVNPDGTEYTTVAHIDISPTALAASGDVLYGATGNQVFSVNTDGSGLEILAEMSSSISQVVVANDRLFGVTRTSTLANGGDGTLFRSRLDGSNLEVIHEFGPGPGNGRFPNNDLTIIGSTLFGSTFEGGLEASERHPLGGGGVVYSISVDASAVPEPNSFSVWLVLSAIVSIGFSTKAIARRKTRCCDQLACRLGA